MALPSQGTLSSDLISSEVGAPTATTHKLAGDTTPTTDSMIYWYRTGNVGTTGVNQASPFNYSDFYGQEALYKCTKYIAAGSTGTATIVVYPGISTNISVPANTTYSYCTRINYDGSLAATSISGLTTETGSACNGNITTGNSAGSTDSTYGINGVKLYSSFNINGSGTSTNFLCNDAGGTYAGTFWANPSNTTTDGRLNQTGIWSGSSNYVGTGSLAFGILVPTTSTYYVGIGCDNYGAVYLDNVLQLAQTADFTSVDNFRYWHIYPISMNAGVRLLRVTGINNPGTPGSNPGSIGVEVYNNTFTEISASIAASPNGSSTPAGLNILYSSKDYKGGGVIGAAFDNQAVQCPLVTTTTTTTSTTTTTTTAASYLVTFYARLDTVNPPLIDPQFHISTDGGENFTLVGSLIDSTTCTLRYSTNFAAGTSVFVEIVDPNNTTIKYRFGGTTTSSTCPAVGTLTSRIFTVTANRDTAFTVQDA